MRSNGRRTRGAEQRSQGRQPEREGTEVQLTNKHTSQLTFPALCKNVQVGQLTLPTRIDPAKPSFIPTSTGNSSSSSMISQKTTSRDKIPADAIVSSDSRTRPLYLIFWDMGLTWRLL